ncbi:hypothetical protein CCR75_006335 [Bremia lactucae]|uniref:RxLR effector protein n=1 Tax=Bremia lactucae TaxID=4779 RepID=A0A976FRD8_BRELC|nr:hypothetical protein CCR75_006335 [Bremia lactucae]
MLAAMDAQEGVVSTTVSRDHTQPSKAIYSNRKSLRYTINARGNNTDNTERPIEEERNFMSVLRSFNSKAKQWFHKSFAKFRGTSTHSPNVEKPTLLAQRFKSRSLNLLSAVDSTEVRLLKRLQANTLAQDHFESFVELKGTKDILKASLKIPKDSTLENRATEAYSLLMQLRTNRDAFTKLNPKEAFDFHTVMKSVDDSEIARKHYGLFMDGTLDEVGLTKLVGGTSTDLAAALSILKKAQALNDDLGTKSAVLKQSISLELHKNLLAQKYLSKFDKDPHNWRKLDAEMRKNIRFSDPSFTTDAIDAATSSIAMTYMLKYNTDKKVKEYLKIILEDATAKKTIGRFLTGGMNEDELKGVLKITKDTLKTSNQYVILGAMKSLRKSDIDHIEALRTPG